jgi:hypothetical protein
VPLPSSLLRRPFCRDARQHNQVMGHPGRPPHTNFLAVHREDTRGRVALMPVVTSAGCDAGALDDRRQSLDLGLQSFLLLQNPLTGGSHLNAFRISVLHRSVLGRGGCQRWPIRDSPQFCPSARIVGKPIPPNSIGVGLFAPDLLNPRGCKGWVQLRRLSLAAAVTQSSTLSKTFTSSM